MEAVGLFPLQTLQQGLKMGFCGEDGLLLNTLGQNI